MLMKKRLLGAAMGMLALMLSFFAGWAAPAQASVHAAGIGDGPAVHATAGDDDECEEDDDDDCEDCDEDDDDCIDDEDDCESYLNGDEDDDDEDDDDDECEEENGFIGSSNGGSGDTSNDSFLDGGANLGTADNSWILTLAGMVLVYATLWRIVRRRLAGT
jgi:hypothetical protein